MITQESPIQQPSVRKGSQGILPFRYEAEGSKAGITALAGLPVYLDLAAAIGMSKSIRKHVRVRMEGGQGWTDSQVVLALVLLNLAGGDHVEDLNLLEADEGFGRVLRRVEHGGLMRKVRRCLERRWRKERRRTMPSPSAVFRYLAAFHDEGQERLRVPGKAFIPAPNEALRGLGAVNGEMAAFLQRHHPVETATLDADATVIGTTKAEALWCYEGYPAYQPINIWWAEQEVVLYTEFRDGNVPAGHEIRRVVGEALVHLPEGIKTVRLRSDTAAYQHDFLRWCDDGANKPVGRIEFTVGCDVTGEFKKAVAGVEGGDWHPLYREVNGEKIGTGQEWAEVCFVPNAIGHSRSGPQWRYLAIREVLKQRELPGMEEQMSLPFPTLEMTGQRYKLFGMVTNMEWDGGDLIPWHYRRCGKSEEAHAIMKDDLAGGTMPSGKFGENAAWWWIMMLALNLNAILKRLALPQEWTPKRMKAVRLSLIRLPGKILERSRCMMIRLRQDHPALPVLLQARLAIARLAFQPSG